MAAPVSLISSVPNLALVLGVGVLALACWTVVSKARKAKRPPLPPGPPSEFILGHMRVVPFDSVFLQYDKWAREYSRSSEKLAHQEEHVADVNPRL
jgi:hypothetical protein